MEASTYFPFLKQTTNEIKYRYKIRKPNLIPFEKSNSTK